MNNDSFNLMAGKKLKEIRESLNLTLQDVSNKMGFNNYQILSSIEKGERQIKANELMLLSRLYNVDFKEIVILETKEVRKQAVIWRDKIDLDTCKQYEDKLHKLCENMRYLENLFNIKPTIATQNIEMKLSEMSYENIREMAKRYLKTLSLGDRPAYSLSKIIESVLGVNIFYIDMGGAGSAASTNGEYGPAILLNSSNVPWRRNYDLAHELFHLLTWNLIPTDDQSCKSIGEINIDLEKYANVFASYLLIPYEALLTEFNKRLNNHKISFYDCVEMAKEFGVSIEALLYASINYGLIDRKETTKVMDKIKIVDKIARKNDEYNYVNILSDKYVGLAFRAYAEGFITKGVLAQFLFMDRYDLTKFLEDNGYQEKERYNFEISSAS